MKLDIRGRLNLKGEQGKPDGILAKFQKRSQDVLEKMYDDREKRTKASGMGKSIWDQEKMEAFGLQEFNCKKAGSYFFDVLPLSFELGVPYARDICVHFNVGFNQDTFICPHRYQSGKCYRCEVQARLFRETPRIPGGKVPDHIKALYPGDREGYLIWDRTAELLNGESPSDVISVWNMPKMKVHGEIQSRVRDKITRYTLDISDLTPGGEGRTVSFEVSMEGQWPVYKGFELNVRPAPITPQILQKLDELITAANADGFKNVIDYLLHVPTYDEIKESMLTEVEIGKAVAPDEAPDEDPGEQGAATPPQTPASQKMKLQPFPLQGKSDEEIMSMIVTKYENLQAKLTSMSPIQWMMWLKSEGKEFAEAVQGFDKETAITAIIEVMLTEECAKAGIKI